MAIITTDSKNYTDIAAAIRGKNGSTAQYKPNEMAAAINAIVAGGGDESQIPTDEELTITGVCEYRFAYNGWNWLINKYGNRITTKDISNAASMFRDNNSLIEIPFEINLSDSCSNIQYMFMSCNKLKKISKINFPSILPQDSLIRYLFNDCHNLRELPEGFENINWDNYHLGTSSHNGIFYNCRSLRSIPKNILKNIYNKSSYSNSFYYNGCQNCYVLDELDGIPVEQGTLTSNCLSSIIVSGKRLKNFIFDTNDNGSAKTANWKNQIIDLAYSVGFAYASYSSQNNLNWLTDYNSGIDVSKGVYDDETYQALKDDPDWFVDNSKITFLTEEAHKIACSNYSRYNHDSAVRTINSLPDTSEYLATNGGTNTIKFYGNSGAKTDGGAINTLTEEEIAVATAKGWTVTLV